jgi:tetratricopeptide (TPR) repeat protein
MFRWWLSALALAGCAVEVDQEREDAVNAYLQKAYTNYQLGKFEQAGKDYAQVLRFQPDNASALVGSGDVCVEIANRTLEEAYNLHQSARKEGSDAFDRVRATLDSMLTKSINLHNRAVSFYEHVRKNFRNNEEAYMGATFGLGKLHYFRICPPYTPYLYAIDGEMVNNKPVAVVRDQKVRDAIEHDHKAAFQYLEEYLKRDPDKAYESRRYLATLLLVRNGPGDRDRSHKLFKEYMQIVERVKKVGLPKIIDAEWRRVYEEFIDREIVITREALAEFEKR